jgi:hypothetical protein
MNSVFAEAVAWLRGRELKQTSRRAWAVRDERAIQRAMAADLPTEVLVAELKRRGMRLARIAEPIVRPVLPIEDEDV